MLKHIISFFVILVFLLLAVGSTDEGGDPTDTETIRDCKPIIPWTYSPNIYVNIANKRTGEIDIGGNVEMIVRYYEFQYEPIGCEGYLEVIYNNKSEYTIDESGFVSLECPAFIFSEDSEIIEIIVKCQASEDYNFQTSMKSRIISAKYSTDDEMVGMTFAFLKDDDL